MPCYGTANHPESYDNAKSNSQEPTLWTKKKEPLSCAEFAASPMLDPMTLKS